MSVEVRVYNPDLELQGIIDEFSSLIWIRRYQGAGEFELHTPYSEESRSLLVAGNIVQKYDGKTVLEAGIIEYLKMSKDEIVVKGRFLEILLDMRAATLFASSSYSGTAEVILRDIISDIIYSEYRAIPLLELGPFNNLSETIQFQVSAKIILPVFSKVCRATALGFRIYPDFTARKLYFEVYKGADRASDSSSKVIFSETYNNLMNEVYTYDNTNYRTAGFAHQTINDHIYIVPTAGSSVTGLDRREIFIQTSIDSENKTGAEIQLAMYKAAVNALKNYAISETFTFSTDVDATFKYREDYDLGDLVIINHIAWDIYQTRRITEIEEDYEGGTVNVILTCGDPLPETIDFKEGY